jgi:molybdopterin synthase catalytic subunit
VSAPHRGEAFAGAREVIDRIKSEVPIWKKEFEDGEERWVEGTAPGA